MESKYHSAIIWAILAAVLYALSLPTSKLLLGEISPTMMAALLYLGAGLGMFIMGYIRRKCSAEQKEAPLTKKEMPFIIAMIVLDIAAPIFLMIGLTKTAAANASLLNNFEIVATSVIALVIFKEAISKKLWLAILLITISSMILSVDNLSGFVFSFGSLFVLLACICWGFENNCTRMLAVKDPLEIVVIKGFGSGLGSLCIALLLQEQFPQLPYLVAALLVGFFAYGLSIFFYVYAQRELGAAKTSAYYAIAPFIGVILSFLIFKEIPTLSFVLALLIMIVGVYFASIDTHTHLHKHLAIGHEHRHNHNDNHHHHTHDKPVTNEHSHWHYHEACTHTHSHTQDIHHTHTHS